MKAEFTLDCLFAMEEADHDFFPYVIADAPEETKRPLLMRVCLKATWTDDGTAEGTIEEECRIIPTITDEDEFNNGQKLKPADRAKIQFIYIPAARYEGSDAVTKLLKGRLWKAAKWSNSLKQTIEGASKNIEEQFSNEGAAQIIQKQLDSRWKELHGPQGRDANVHLNVLNGTIEELVRNTELLFAPDESGGKRKADQLSDGQRSLLYIAMTAASIELEHSGRSGEGTEHFNQEDLHSIYLTILGIEEPENSLAPFYLSRLMKQARGIGENAWGQTILSSHSPAILSRVEPEEIRYCRLNEETFTASVKALTLPEKKSEALKYIRLAVKAYPELYFARFVILGEGDSERILIPKIAEAMGIDLDPSFVPVVPLAGRYTEHFRRLLKDLDIPYAVLLDLDLGRSHGGIKIMREQIEQLGSDKPNFDGVKEEGLLNEAENHTCIRRLREHDVFFSFPIDIDFAMLHAFPDAYQQKEGKDQGPKDSSDGIKSTLKKNGNASLYHGSKYKAAFKWYPYLFLGERGKPESHLRALSHITTDNLKKNAPESLKALILHVQQILKLNESAVDETCA